MGEGETMTFAEAMALQKAKQTALEQAGTYVETYTKTQNYQLTTDEIQTIAGGVLQVEVLEKTRTLVGDGLKFFVKIKATVTTDKVAELAQRIKGKNVAEEYKRLQENYTRLNKEFETWKQLVIKTPHGPQRDNALDQMKKHEQEVVKILKMQSTFVEQLLAGSSLIAAAKEERAELEQFAVKLLYSGPKVAIGEVKAMPILGSANLSLSIPLTLSISDGFLPDLNQAAKRHDGWVKELPDNALVVVALLTDHSDSAKRHYFWNMFYEMSILVGIEFTDGNVRTCLLASNQTREGLEIRGKPVFLDDFPFNVRNSHSEWISLHLEDFPLRFFVLDVKQSLVSPHFLGHVPTNPRSNNLTFVVRTTSQRITVHLTEAPERVKAIARVTAEFTFGGPRDKNQMCQFD